jgi:hypothetical protein
MPKRKGSSMGSMTGHDQRKALRVLTEAEVAALQRRGVRVIEQEPVPSVQRPTSERMAHGGVIVAEEERLGRAKPWYTFESPQDEMLAAAQISQKAWEAANSFQSTWNVAVGSGVRAGGTGEPVSKSTGDMGNQQALALGRLKRWSHEMAPQLYEVLASVIGTGEAPSTWARNTNRHPTAGRYLLAAALEQFALTK